MTDPTTHAHRAHEHEGERVTVRLCNVLAEPHDPHFFVMATAGHICPGLTTLNPRERAGEREAGA